MIMISYRSPKGRVRVDVVGFMLTAAAATCFAFGHDSAALGLGVMGGLSSIAFGIDGLRDDLAAKAGL